MRNYLYILCILISVLLCGCGRTLDADGEKENTVVSSNEDTRDINEDMASLGKAKVDVPGTSLEGAEIDVSGSSLEEIKSDGISTFLEEKEEPEEDTLSIIMVGDILLHTPVEEAARDENGNYSFDFIFREMKDEISAADIAIVNQEVIIGGEELGITGYPSFNAPTEIGNALVEAGFDVVCHGTNHALDKGKKGVVNTINYWKNEHPEMIIEGINEDEEEYRAVTVIEKKGMRIAILNYTYGTNGISAPSDMPHAVDLLSEDKIRTDLAYAEENADFTIVCPHWGTEYRLDADSGQKRWNELFRECGADLIIGTHPHVIEPIDLSLDENEGISNNHGDGDMLTYYSLGNFVNWTSGTGAGTANRMVGGMAEVTLVRLATDGLSDRTNDNTKGNTDVNTKDNTKNNTSTANISESTKDNAPSYEVVIKDFGIRALVCHLTPAQKGITVYPLSEYSKELGSQNAIKSQDSSFSKQYCIDLCNRVWGENNWH